MKRIAILLFVVLLAACGQAAPTATLQPGQEYLLDVQPETALDLSGAWRAAAVDRFTPEMTQAGFDDSGWAEVDVPASWEAQGFGGLTGSGAVVVYRKLVDVPKDWKGKEIGIGAWLNPLASQVYVNGAQISPERTPFSPYAPVTVTPGEQAVVTVVTQYDGKADMAEASPARLGPLGQRPVTGILRDPLDLSYNGQAIDGFIARPAYGEKLPGLLLVSTGTHGLGELEGWQALADDLARQGYLSLVPAIPEQTPEAILAALEALRANPLVDPERIAILAGDQAAGPAVQAAIQDGGLRGLVLLSPGKIAGLEQLGKPVMAFASEKDQNGRLLKALQELATQNPEQVTVEALPGDAHATYLLSVVWDQLRTPLIAWLTRNLS